MKDFKRGQFASLDDSSIYGEYSYSWVNSVLKFGSTKALEQSDLPSIPISHMSSDVYMEICTKWNKELATNPDNPSLFRVIYESCYWRFLLFCVSNLLLFNCALLIQPFLVGAVLEYVAQGQTSSAHFGVLLAFALGGMSVLGQFAANTGHYFVTRLAVYLRSGLIALIYQKTMNLSNASRASRSSGDILTLIGVDIERVFMAIYLSNWLWMSVLLMTATVVLLFIEVGYSALIVVIFLIGFLYLQEIISKRIGQIRRQLVTVTSTRGKITNEYLQGIRVIKLYGWESPSEIKLSQVRSEELVHLFKYLIMKIINTVREFANRLLYCCMLD